MASTMGGASGINTGLANVTLSGVQALGVLGSISLSTNNNISVTGLSATGVVGTLDVIGQANVLLTGVDATGETGTVTIAGKAVILPTGIQSFGVVGNIDLSTNNYLDVSGLAASGQINSVDVKGKSTNPVTGFQMVGSVGSVAITGKGNVYPIGVEGTGQLGFGLVWGLIDEAQSPAWANITSDILNAPIGTFIAGGYLAGFVSESQDGVATYALIVAPAESGQPLMNFVAESGQVNLPANLSPIDGKLNTDLLINNYALGPAFPAVYCKNLVYNGFDDWYLPSGYELEIIYYNLAPTNPEIYRQYWYDKIAGPPFNDPSLAENKFNTKYNEFGVNPFSVPSRANVPYTYTVPGQTTSTIFQTGGPQAFLFEPVVGTTLGYWSSGVTIGGIPTFSETYGICFADGSLVSSDISTSQSLPVYYVRPVRRVYVGQSAWTPVGDSQTPSWQGIPT